MSTGVHCFPQRRLQIVSHQFRPPDMRWACRIALELLHGRRWRRLLESAAWCVREMVYADLNITTTVLLSYPLAYRFSSLLQWYVPSFPASLCRVELNARPSVALLIHTHETTPTPSAKEWHVHAPAPASFTSTHKIFFMLNSRSKLPLPLLLLKRTEPTQTQSRHARSQGGRRCVLSPFSLLILSSPLYPFSRFVVPSHHRFR